MIYKINYKDCLQHINRYWKRIICYHPRDKQLRFGLPHRYVVPNEKTIFHNDQFYWDSYFIILGLVVSNKTTLARGMIDNFTYLFKKFGIIPMRNRYYNLGTSQIPFLTSMILEVYSKDKNISWLRKTAKIAELELEKYWMNSTMTEKHLVHRGLSRYCDHYITHLGAEHESGWDMTSRFHNRCLDYLPVDLNTCLYKYETDLAVIYGILKNPVKQKLFQLQAKKRKKVIQSLMWNRKRSFYFDYNYRTKKQNNFFSVAGFYPLWAQLASPEQAAKMVEKILPKFENDGGIVNTLDKFLSDDIKQHDYPNGWPGQQWIVIKGLLNYGFKREAERIAKKWLDMNENIFAKTGELWEKYDVVNCKIGVFNPHRYKTQSGFAWTNAVFVRLVNEFSQ